MFLKQVAKWSAICVQLTIGPPENQRAKGKWTASSVIWVVVPFITNSSHSYQIQPVSNPCPTLVKYWYERRIGLALVEHRYERRITEQKDCIIRAPATELEL